MDETPTIDNARALASAIFQQAIRDINHDDSRLKDRRGREAWWEAREDTLCWVETAGEGFCFWCTVLGVAPDAMRRRLLEAAGEPISLTGVMTRATVR